MKTTYTKEEISFSEFKKIVGIGQEEGFCSAMHMAGLLYTPHYPSGCGSTESTGWVDSEKIMKRFGSIKPKDFIEYKAVCIADDGCMDSVGWLQGNTEWRIKKRVLNIKK